MHIEWFDTIIISGVIIGGLGAIAMLIGFMLEDDRLFKEFQSAKPYKIREGLLWRKIYSPFVFSRMLPKDLWYEPLCPIYGETEEMLIERCRQYNQEYQDEQK